jgi:hypothetical protein
LRKYPDNARLLQKIMNLCNVSSEQKEITLEHFLPFFKYFPENHRKLYRRIQKIIRWNKKGTPFGISVFKLWLRQNIFKNQLFLEHVNFFLYQYKLENTTEQEMLATNKILLKKYIFEIFKRITYDRLLNPAEKNCCKEYMVPIGFLEINACETAAEEIYKNKLFKQIYSYYLPRLNKSQQSTNCHGFRFDNLCYTSKMKLCLLNCIINNRITFEITYNQDIATLAIMDIIEQPLNYTMSIKKEMLPPPPRKKISPKYKSESKSVFYHIIKNMFLTFMTFLDYTISFFNYLLIF